MLLDIALINKKISNMDGWNYENHSIHKNYVLKNFAEAVAFVVKVGIEAEKIDHHPEIFLYAWNNVKISLSTHSSGGVTDKDFTLAQQIDKINP